jgi:RNA polymerase sigma-70 factor (ECF subfamily)
VSAAGRTRLPFEQRVAAVHPVLVRYGFALTHDRDDAHDLAQATIARALSQRQQYREQGRMTSWLCNILHNLFVNDWRQQRREGLRTSIDEVFNGTTNEWIAAEHPALAREGGQRGFELRRDLLRALERLTEDKREVLLMAVYDGMTYDEMAAQLDIPVGTVRSRLARARALMREFLGHPPKTRDEPAALPSHEHLYGKRTLAELRRGARPRKKRRRRSKGPRVAALVLTPIRRVRE